MKPRSVFGPSLAAMVAWVGGASAATAATEARPNFVVILADDLGYGDLGCYGNARNRTPNLDRLATEGVRFTDFHSNGPMCTPTRVALLTGRYQHRFGRMFESALGGRAGDGPGLPLEAVTLAERLKEAGYATGMFGKWHLGYKSPNLPTRQGFDEFRGLLSGDGDHHTRRDRSGGHDWWHGEEHAEETGYTTELLTRHSVNFIERNRERPFLLYIPHLAIHFPWQGPDDPPHRVEERNYESEKWGLLRDPMNVASHVKAMVEALDASVGAVIATLRRLKLDERTMIVFMSDNGGYIAYGTTHRNISSNGPLRGQKGEVFEGGHRVPGIVWWPGRIMPRVDDSMVMSFDFFPTLLRLAGYSDVSSDGLDLGPLLFRKEALPERTVFWRMRNLRAVRQGSWKLVRNDEDPPALFDLREDIGEVENLAALHGERVARLEREFAAWEKEISRGIPAVARGR